MKYHQKVKVTVQNWEYTKIYETLVGGNVPGFGIFECAIENIVNKIVEESYGYDDLDVDDCLTIHLENDDGETLEINLNEEGDPEESFKEMVVAIEIIGMEKSEFNFD